MFKFPHLSQFFSSHSVQTRNQKDSQIVINYFSYFLIHRSSLLPSSFSFSYALFVEEASSSARTVPDIADFTEWIFKVLTHSSAHCVSYKLAVRSGSLTLSGSICWQEFWCYIPLLIVTYMVPLFVRLAARDDHRLDQWFSTRVVLPLRGHLALSGDIFDWNK